GADAVPDRPDERLVQRNSSGQPHEQDDAHVVLPILTDADRLDDLRHLLDLIVDLRSPDPHPARIERRIGTSVDDDAAMLRPFGKVAMAPDILEPLEIGCAVFRAVRVIPEHDGHRGKRPSADELALFAAHRLAVVIPYVDGKAKARPLD